MAEKSSNFDARFRRPSAPSSHPLPTPPAPYPLSTQVGTADLISLPPEAMQLNPAIQGIARQLIASKRRVGEEILTAARLIAAARAQTEHGMWLLFLQVTNTGEDTAERLLNIHARAEQLQAFGEAITCGWLTESAAWRLAQPSTPNTIIDQVLALPEPPTVRQIEATLRAAKRAQHATGPGAARDAHIPPRGGICADTVPALRADQEATVVNASATTEPLPPEMRVHIPALTALAERYSADPTRLSAQDRDLLTPLAHHLATLLRRLTGE